MEKKKILIIDDSHTNLLLLESMFEDDARVVVLLKSSGKGIVKYCLKHNPDLILLDLMMPEINGFEVLEILQSHDELKKIPIIIISALDGKVHIKRAIEMGANDYIVKPINFEENTQLIYRTLGLESI